ncbi:CheA signal transduction histidine kinase [Paraglaciecola sp. T6c]|uniref:chemotaxis protein CheA n=1 Tax=Pseudoalteromonas atlantica (strain T6c / ATCC BAA-1087) TaxID=3042615 RepID=UPI00005C52D0|nr:chemotaxis protein CheA [Paraglaciecola sp. T6c]ABG41533.1 CheA signal transduction histidine kinase [Paraglaciecola sp. T6c]
MGFDVDEEILQDFLVEAGEILEQLQEQLVELENNPQDSDLLNAIFRGYHTVKGGAGFLSLTELVDICHGAENVFDVMRNGQRSLTPELMDIILQATDEVVAMFEDVKSNKPLVAAEQSLLDTLHRLSKPEAQDQVAAPPIIETPVIEAPSEAASQPKTNSDDFDESEFEALLDELHGEGNPVGGASQSPSIKPPQSTESSSGADMSSDGDDISDDEFEALLDQLHGEGQFGGSQDAPSESTDAPVASTNSESEDISDDEFEALLDQLHGKGQGPVTKKEANGETSKAPNTPVTSAVSDNTPSQSASEKATDKSNDTKSSAPSIASSQANIPAKSPGAAEKSAVSKREEKRPAAPQPETTVRVDTKRLDQIMNMVGELVLVRNRLLSLGLSVNDESMSKAIANLDVVTGDLQGAVMKTRMQPIKKVFGRFPRVVRDLARTLKKEITLELEGEETDLDKNLVEALADPLVHLVRNSVDHGIEMPADRVAAGKPSLGTVKLSASQEGDHILLSIVDDGKGMDPDKLKEIAISRGVLDADAAARMTDEEAFNLIFAPGFSTKTEISEVSGRGVGMDVVKTKINQLNGTVNIDSVLGKGTTLEIKVPLTLAILPTLMIVVGDQTFALPLGSVNEIINMDMSKTNTVDGQLTKIVRSKAIPLFYLREWLVRKNAKPIPLDRAKGHVVVVQIGTQQLGFVVDALIGQEEVVIKPLDELLQGTPGMAGATITSDGGIALILDVPGLLKHYAKKKADAIRQAR